MRVRESSGIVVALLLALACGGTAPLSDSLRGEDSGAPEPSPAGSMAPPTAGAASSSDAGAQAPIAGRRSPTPGSAGAPSRPLPAAGSGSAGRGSAAGSGSAGRGPAAGSGGAASTGEECPPGFAAPPVCEPCPGNVCARPACRNGSFSHWKCPDMASGCVKGGCSGQLCSDASQGPLVSTCEFREEYACYRTARCERQSSGACGWTQTPELMQCLANPSSADAGI